MTLRTKGSAAVLALLAAAVLSAAACDMSLGNLTGRATDEWTHTYPLAPGGEIRIVNTNGRIEVEAVDGSQVEVRAERVARGATDAAARELLPRITIREDAKPDRITLETERISGVLIGVGYEVRYHVKAPKTAAVDLRNTNGQIAVTGLAGKTIAQTTNGGVVGRNLTGEIDARTTNGGVNIDVAEIGSAPIRAHTTNGGVTVALPQSAKADVYATWTNGGLNVSSDLKIDVTERGRRRFEGKMNGGGASVTLETTNGGIRLRPRSGQAVETEDRGDGGDHGKK